MVTNNKSTGEEEPTRFFQHFEEDWTPASTERGPDVGGKNIKNVETELETN